MGGVDTERSMQSKAARPPRREPAGPWTQAETRDSLGPARRPAQGPGVREIDAVRAGRSRRLSEGKAAGPGSTRRGKHCMDGETRNGSSIESLGRDFDSLEA